MTKNRDQELSDAELDLAVGGSGTGLREGSADPIAVVTTSPAPAAEDETLRLKMAMEQSSMLTSTISNLLKRASDAQSRIMNNLK